MNLIHKSLLEKCDYATDEEMCVLITPEEYLYLFGVSMGQECWAQVKSIRQQLINVTIIPIAISIR